MAGCLSSSSEEEPSQSPKTTSFPDVEEIVQNLKFTADIINQQSQDTPVLTEARISNVGSEKLELGFGPALMISDGTSSDNEAWPEDLVLDPKSNVGSISSPVQSDDGCWRFPEDGRIIIQSSLSYRELAPEESISERYQIYTAASAKTCLPSGKYKFQDNIIGRKSNTSVLLKLTLNIDGEVEISASMEGNN